MDASFRWLLLKSIRGIGNRSLKMLFQAFGSSESILSADEESLARVVGPKKAKSILLHKGKGKEEAHRILRSIQGKNIRLVTFEDEEYPKQFLNLPDPPPVLFVKGKIRSGPFVGIVGARKASDYSLKLVEEVVEVAVRSGYRVVSGGAPGIDSKAHQEAIEKGGHTLCILGMGLLKVSLPLFKRIENSNNVLISEFLPDQPADKYTFAHRNRLIASLSDILIVPEASSKSGAIITAEWAFRLGKKVFVHLGIMRSPRWEGCYRLVKEEKAQLFAYAEEIFGKTGQSTENRLKDFLRVPRTLDEIANFLNMSTEDTLSLLTDLEMKGEILRSGSLYSTC